MGIHVPGFQSFFSFLHHYVTAKLATSSIRFKTGLLIPFIHGRCRDVIDMRKIEQLKSFFQ